jgi:hypothetical protein
MDGPLSQVLAPVASANMAVSTFTVLVSRFSARLLAFTTYLGIEAICKSTQQVQNSETPVYGFSGTTKEELGYKVGV